MRPAQLGVIPGTFSSSSTVAWLISMRISGGGAVAEVAYGLLGSRSWIFAIPARDAQRIASAIAANIVPVRTAPLSACSGAVGKRAIENCINNVRTNAP